MDKGLSEIMAIFAVLVCLPNPISLLVIKLLCSELDSAQGVMYRRRESRQLVALRVPW